MSEKNNISRYPGLRPFSENESHLFFGRDYEIDHIYKLINIEKLLVIYGKSGMGKSSLIEAGIVRRLRKDQSAVFYKLRFGYFNTQSEDLTQRVCRITHKELPKEHILEKLCKNNTSLWRNIKAHQLENNKNTILLIFDQFEEIFSYSNEQIVELKKSLASVMYNIIPDEFRQAITRSSEYISDEELDMLYEAPNLKTIFIIRSDRMSELNKLSDALPDIVRKNFELQTLSLGPAKDAITKPATDDNQNYSSPKFTYSPETIEAIFKLFENKNKRNPNESIQIDSTQLQVICSHIEEQIVEKAKTSTNNLQVYHVDITELGELNKVFDKFYNNQIAKIPEEERRIANKLLEEMLVMNGNQNPVSDHTLQSVEGVTPILLGRLVQLRLVRVEPNNLGGNTYELSHDTLVKPVSEAASKHLQEKKIKEEKDKLLKEQMRLKLEQTENMKKRKQQKKIITSISFAAFAFVIISIICYFLYKKAEEKTVEAEKATRNVTNLYIKSLSEQGDFDKALESLLQANSKSKTKEYSKQIEIFRKLKIIWKEVESISITENKSEQLCSKLKLISEAKSLYPACSLFSRKRKDIEKDIEEEKQNLIIRIDKFKEDNLSETKNDERNLNLLEDCLKSQKKHHITLD